MVVSCPLLKFIQTKLQLMFSDTHIGRYVANLKIINIYEQSTPICGILSGPAEVSWALCRASCNSSIEKGLLYTSALSDEKFKFWLSAFLQTDAEAAVLKPEEELCQTLSGNA